MTEALDEYMENEMMRARITFGLIALLGISLFARQVGGTGMVTIRTVPDGHIVTLDSGKLRLVFEVANGKLLFRELSAAGGENWLTAPAEDLLLWSLTFEGPDGASKRFKSCDLKLSEFKEHGEGVEFLWKYALGDGVAKVVMSIRVKKDDPLSRWTLKAEVPQGWNVVRSDFPRIPNIKLKQGKHFIPSVVTDDLEKHCLEDGKGPLSLQSQCQDRPGICEQDESDNKGKQGLPKMQHSMGVSS